MSTTRWEQLLRYRFIEIIALWEGRLTTKHLCEVFGIGRQQASKDINNYKRSIGPGNLEYDGTAKGYRPSATFDFYRGKRVFAEVSDTVLMDYVSAGHIAQPDGSVTLRHSGAWEACIYRSVPRMTGALKSVACPMLIVAGETSDVLNAERLSWAKAINPAAEIQSLAGGHLLPLEAPEACAKVAADFIRRY
jgi:pimeloyl-ACP methyl ester carboxylesterase